MNDKTSDGISKEEWKEIEELAEKIVSADDSDDENLAREYTRDIIRKLNNLQNKYGDLPSILATKADYVDDINQALIILKKAYEIAQSMNDKKNLTLISSSLAQKYIEELEDNKQGKIWLDELRINLNNSYDDYEFKEYIRLRKFGDTK